MTGIWAGNGRYSRISVTIPTSRYRTVGIAFGRYRRPLYLPKSDYTPIARHQCTPVATIDGVHVGGVWVLGVASVPT